MRYCLWCMNRDEMTLTSFTIGYRGQQLPACQAHAILVTLRKDVHMVV